MEPEQRGRRRWNAVFVAIALVAAALLGVVGGLSVAPDGTDGEQAVDTTRPQPPEPYVPPAPAVFSEPKPAPTTTTTTAPPPPPPPAINLLFTAFSSTVQGWDGALVARYEGNAKSGAEVTVSSPYGGGSATAGADGRWVVDVRFSGSSPGESWSVVVASQGASATFPYSHVPAPDSGE